MPLPAVETELLYEKGSVGDLRQIAITKGMYRLTWRAPTVAHAVAWEIHAKLPFLLDRDGVMVAMLPVGFLRFKKVAVYRPERSGQDVTVLIDVLENPLPAWVFILALAGLLGMFAFFLLRLERVIDVSGLKETLPKLADAINTTAEGLSGVIAPIAIVGVGLVALALVPMLWGRLKRGFS